MNEAFIFIQNIWMAAINITDSLSDLGPLQAAFFSAPFILFFELPMQALIMFGVFRYAYRKDKTLTARPLYHPRVSCLITCYSEGEDVKNTIRSLTTQIYPGHIEIIAIIDGAIQNEDTHVAVQKLESFVKRFANRTLVILPRLQRGGRVSSLNTGLQISSGEIVMALDGDTSFDNDMVSHATRHFVDINVVGVAGNLRVRNTSASLVARLQSLEYMLSIHASRTGLDQFNVVNNISGAFGVFKKSFLVKLGGWSNGTAEDLDLTLRIKKYFGRHPELRIKFDPCAIGHTDVPDTFRGFFQQRLRWDGDLFYLYLRKFRTTLRPSLLGWRNYLMFLWSGLYFQIVLPLGIIVYSSFLLYQYPIEYVLGLALVVYSIYLFLTLLLFLQYMFFLSERPKDDLSLIWFIPLLPVLAFAARIWSGIATLSDLFLRSHLDSSMAPWWVLKKVRY